MDPLVGRGYGAVIRAYASQPEGPAVPERAQRLVVVLYEHPLLGEGIARFIVLAETGAEVVVARTGNRRVAQDVLARDPDVVILECARCDECDLDVARLAPRAVVMDVSAAMTTGSAVPPVACMETIMVTVRGVQEPPSCGGTAHPAAPLP